MSHTLEIPGWVPPSVNRLIGVHWAVARRTKKRAYHTVGLAALVARVPLAQGKRRVTIEVTIAGRHRMPDQDNVQKALLDALTYCRLLRDDGPAWVEVAPVVVRKGAQPGTVVVLEDMEE